MSPKQYLSEIKNQARIQIKNAMHIIVNRLHTFSKIVTPLLKVEEVKSDVTKQWNEHVTLVYE